MSRVIFILAAIHCTFGLSAAWAQDESWLAGEETELEQRVYQALEQTGSLDFEEMPLSGLIDYLREVTKLDFVIDRKSLEVGGVSAEVPVTIQTKAVTYKSALKLLLDQHDLTWILRGGAVFITTKAEAENLLAIKIYDVRDLVSEGPSGEIELQSLVRVLTSCVAPTTWDEVGGPGSVMEYRGPHVRAIVIGQTREVHDEIASLFASMRKLGKRTPAEQRTIPSRAAMKRMNSSTRRGGLESARTYAAAPEWSQPRVHE